MEGQEQGQRLEHGEELVQRKQRAYPGRWVCRLHAPSHLCDLHLLSLVSLDMGREDCCKPTADEALVWKEFSTSTTQNQCKEKESEIKQLREHSRRREKESEMRRMEKYLLEFFGCEREST
jgi:hypothetical protein